MNTRLLGSLLLAGASVVLATAQQPGPPDARKARLHDVPTPGVLQPLRRVPSETFSLDTQGLVLPPSETSGVDPATGARYRRGELLVRFKEGVAGAVRAQALRASGATRTLRVLPRDWELIGLEPAVEARTAREVLERAASVRDVSLNYLVSPQQFHPNDEGFSLQWNFDAINLPDAWEINPGSRNDVTVAVVDSGLNTVTDTFVFTSPFVGQVPIRFTAVPDLVADGRIVAPFDFVYDDAFPVDLSGHGTHVTGTIAQQTNNNIGVAGVAYNVRLMPLKVISGGSFGSWDDILAPGNPAGSVALLAEAIRYAADNEARVINLSLGTTGPIPIVRDAIEYAVSRGVFVAIAAGNSGDEGNPTMYPASYASAINGAMTVGAVNRGLQRASYSGFQPYVEICAPGGETRTEIDYERGITQVGYEEASTLSFLSPSEKVFALRIGFRPRFDRFELRPFQGTSMATPHVSGVAALLYSQGIRNPAAIEEAIERFARPIATSANECGAGLVDARRALRGLGLGR